MNLNKIYDSETVTRINLNDKEFILLGTAHISHKSVQEVEEIIQAENPDHVCVEIDQERYKSLVEGQKWKNIDIAKLLKEGKGFLLLGNLMLASFQKRLGSKLGIRPGEEMRRAIELAQSKGIPITMADREIQITLKRAWRKAGFFQKNKIMATLLASLFTKEEIDEKELERLKEKSALQEMMEEMARHLPIAKSVLIDERDQYLAAKIFDAPGQKVLAVIGAGHAPGIIKYLELCDQGSKPDFGILNQAPGRSLIGKILPKIIPLAVLGLFAFGIYFFGWRESAQNFGYWFLANGILSALGGLIALAHPLTIVTAFFAAPFTSLNPTIGAGMVTGIVQYYLRKPKVGDLENIVEDLAGFKNFYRNRFLHILLVFALTSLGSMVGTGVGFAWLVSWFGNG